MAKQYIFADANELILLLKGKGGRESFIVNCKDIQRISFAQGKASGLQGLFGKKTRVITIICKKLGGTILFYENKHKEFFGQYLEILRAFCKENRVTFYDFPTE